MQYFFECGHFIGLSIAELSAVLESYSFSKDSINRVSNTILVINNKDITPALADRIFNRLGGFIRYGEVIEDLDSFLKPYYDGDRVVFGISSLGDTDISLKDIQRLSNDIKRNFREVNISSRFLLPKKDKLNAAQIINNDILKKGFELCIFDSSLGRLYGKTRAIQNIDAFVERDLSKPSVDFDMGVLPQKLARIMCNLTALREGVIWDPFCGSGTVLMEAAVLGFNVLGSDIDVQALQATKKNIEWLSKEGMINETMSNIFHLDITETKKKKIKELRDTGIGAVVCEPFMGPYQKHALSVPRLNEILENIVPLYQDFFKVVEAISHKGFKAVLVVPSYKTRKGWATFSLTDIIGKRWEILNETYSSEDLKWSRINSIITRNIFILSKR